MPTCYLHVGGMKTGTTSIQAFMAARRSELFKSGIIATQHGAEKSGRHRPLVLEMGGQPVPPATRGSVEKFSDELKEHPDHDVLLSCESLEHHFNRPTSPIIDFFQGRGYDIKIVVYVRNQVQRINSGYSQHTKSLFGNHDWRDYLASVLITNNLNYSRWIDIAERFKVGIIARPFTATILKDGIIADFLQTIGLSRELDLQEPRANEAASNVAVAVARTFMNRFEKRDIILTSRQRIMISDLLVKEDASIRSSKFYGFKEAELEFVSVRYRGDNEYFASKVWPGTTWQELFHHDLTERKERNELNYKRPETVKLPEYQTILSNLWQPVLEIATDDALGEKHPWTRRIESRDLKGIGRLLTVWDEEALQARSNRSAKAV